MKKLILAFAFLFVVVSSQARTITVDDDGLSDFNNIQAAINDANNGDEIVVADGVYTGTGNRDIDFNGLAITVRSQNGPTNCIIDCNGSELQLHRGFYLHSFEEANSALEGFIIVNGTNDFGGAIACILASPTITNCIIRGNSASLGGGIFCHGNPIIANCIITGNNASYGGGIFASGDVTCAGSPKILNCTFSANISEAGGALFCGEQSNPSMVNCVLWGNSAVYGSEIALMTIDWGSSVSISYTNLQGGQAAVAYYPEPPGAYLEWREGNVDVDPCFADPGNGDYHLKSQAGRWDPNSESWVKDSVTSLAIDAGNPGCPLGDEPNDANNVRINLGAYGGTAEASKTPANWHSIADLTNDWVVDYNDLSIFVDYWLEAGQCIPSDLDRSQSVNLEDFSIFALQWLEAYLGEPRMTYQIGDCSLQALELSTAGLSEQTRFSVTVEGQYIHFEDTMVANCCPDELGLEMTVEGELITIYETELTTMPCRCICDYPVSATLGPFQPGTYTLEVYEDWGGFIGSTTVTIN